MKEHDIRPADLHNKYIELSRVDAETYFRGKPRTAIDCVACDSHNTDVSFEKFGFVYSLCNDCGTLFQNPRPGIEIFEVFYRDSKSSNFWAEEFFPATLENRRDKIFRPRAEKLHELMQRYAPECDVIVDVGAGFGVFLDEWRKLNPKSTLIAIEPSKLMADECRKQGFDTHETLIEDVKGLDSCADVAVCYEVLEHVHSPYDFLKSITKIIKPGGCILISTLSIDGFDLGLLWDRSMQVSPPHHINFLSIDGFEKLFSRLGLENVEVITPGKLDVDIVRNAALEDPNILEGNRFLKEILRSQERRNAFQSFLVDNKLSSHAWVMGRVPATFGENNNE